MEIGKLHVLLKALETGNLTRTAEETGYTQSGITHMMRSIERTWGVTLLLRSHEGVSPTSDARELLPFIREACAAAERLDDRVNAILGLETGSVRVGSINSVSSHMLSPVIGRFSELHPLIDVNVRTGDYDLIEAWILDGSIDIGITKTPTDARIESIELIRDDFRVVLPREHRLAAARTVRPEDLEDEPFIMIDVGANNEFEEFFRTYDVHPNVRFRVKDDFTAMSMVENGLGVSLMAELVLTRQPYDVEVRELASPSHRTITASFLPAAATSTAVRAFLQALSLGCQEKTTP